MPSNYKIVGQTLPDGEFVVAEGQADGEAWVITLRRQIFNWRLYITTPEEMGRSYVAGYCYFGNDAYGTDSYHDALHAAIAWAQEDNPLTTEPPGHNKKAF